MGGVLRQFNHQSTKHAVFKILNLDNDGLCNIICKNTNQALQIEHSSLDRSAKVIGGDFNEFDDNQRFKLLPCKQYDNKDDVEIFQIDFDQMIEKRAENKSEIRRLFKEDRVLDLAFDQFVEIELNHCLIQLSTNYCIDFCIHELMDNQNSNDCELQDERWKACKQNLVEKYQKKQIDFREIWIKHFRDT